MIELSPSAGNEDERITPRWFQRRTHLEKKLLIVSIFVGTILIAFIIDVCISPKDSNAECKHQECVMAASQIIQRVDRTIKPCDDFFKFACGKLKQRTHYKNVPYKMLHAEVQKKALNLLQEDIREDDHQAIKDEKILFKACVTEQKNGVSLEIAKSLLRELNGWPVLMGSEWNEEYFNWSETIIKCKIKDLTHTMLFRSYLRNENNASHKTIEIRPATGIPRDDPHIYVYKDYLTESAIIYGANETDARREMNEVFQFFWALDRLHYDASNSSKPVEFLLSSFQARYPEVNWITYFDTILSPANVTLHDVVVIPRSDYMDNLLELMHNTSKRTLANYLLWSATSNIMLFTSDSFLDMHNHIACFKDFDRLKETDRCEMAMGEIFSLRPSYINYANWYFYGGSRYEIQNIFNAIFFEFKNLLKQVKWLDEASYKNVSKWFDDIKLIIGTPEDDMDKVFGKYKSPPNMHEPFLKFFLEQRKKERSSRVEEKDENDYRFMHNRVQSTLISYYNKQQFFMIPTGFLQGMYYNSQWPMYLNFAGLGKEIGAALSYELAHAASVALYYNSSQEWSSLLDKRVANLSNCLTKNLNLSDIHQGTVKKTFSMNRQLAEMNGLKLAYQAYKKWAQRKDEKRLIGVPYSIEQLFWIWAFSNLCYDELENIEYNIYADNEVVRQNTHFANDFKCELNSKMNPQQKCSIF